MCGLIGMAGDFAYRDKELFEDMLRVCSLRGKHSTGAAAINTRAETYSMAKAVGEPVYLFETKAWDKISTYTNNVMIGHCRHATRGQTTQTNAHPFIYGSIIGAHNGTMLNDKDLAKELDQEFNTDSQALFCHIAKYGVDNTIPKSRGAWALTFYDFETKRLCFIRNKERPLWYCFSKDTNKIFWASEYWMLASQLQRNNVEVWRNEKGEGYFAVPEDTLLQFIIPETGAGSVKLEATRELKGDETKSQYNSPFPPTVRHTPHGQTPTVTSNKQTLSNEEFKAKLKEGVAKLLGPESTETPAESGSTPTSTTSSAKSGEPSTLTGSATSKNPKTTLTLVPTNKSENLDDSLIQGNDGEFLTEEEFRSRVSNGCIWCSATIETKEHADILWVSRDEALCPDCSYRGSEARQYVTQ